MAKTELIKEEKKKAIRFIKEYFISERNEDIDDLAAELVLDFIQGRILLWSIRIIILII
ncbi:MAG: DUF2164 family protein [Actinomycetota bacterium]|nr:DUF2164 family protein [Actinomycetota bacterium]